jgi:hypothetical protein
MNLFSNPKDIQQGDTVFFEYDDKKAFGTCIGFEGDLITVDYTGEFSKEKKIDNFKKGIWKK